MNFLVITLSIRIDDQIIKVLKKGEEKGLFRIYRHQKSLTNHKQPYWTHLLIKQLTNDDSDVENSFIEQIPADVIIRIEKMELTPNSLLQRKGKRKKGITIIEHVNVQLEQLQNFREIMIHNNTPAMQYIIENKNWCFEFIALETKEIVYHNQNFPTWNQIHLIEMSFLAPFLYKKDFEKGLKLANAPSFKENFAHLERIRTFTYKASARKCH